MACCEGIAFVGCFDSSAREIVGKHFLYTTMDVCVESFVIDLVSGYRIEGFTCRKKCSKSKRCCVRPSITVCDMCVRVFVEWLGLKPYLSMKCGMYGVMFGITTRTYPYIF